MTDATLTWRLGGVSLELRGLPPLSPEQCEDLEPITDALDVFARKHGMVEEPTSVNPAQVFHDHMVKQGYGFQPGDTTPEAEEAWMDGQF